MHLSPRWLRLLSVLRQWFWCCFFLFIVTPIVGVCNCSMFCCTLLCVHSSIAIILMGKRELVALLNLSSWGEFNNTSALGRSLYWCQALHITNKDRYQSTSARRALALLNLPLVSRGGWAALLHGATWMSAVFDCGISWSYSLTIFSGV